MVILTLLFLMFQPYYGAYSPSPQRLSLAIGTSCDAWRSLWLPAQQGKIGGLRTKIEYLTPLIDDLQHWTESSSQQLLNQLNVITAEQLQKTLFQWVTADLLASIRVARDKAASSPTAASGWFQIALCNWQLVRPWLETRKRLMANVIDARLNAMKGLLSSATADNIQRYDEFARRIAVDLAEYINTLESNQALIVLETETDQKKIKFDGPCKIDLPAPVRALKLSGIVIYRVTVNPEGKPEEVEILRSPHNTVSDAVKSALKRCKFTRPTKDGKPVIAIATGTIKIKPS